MQVCWNDENSKFIWLNCGRIFRCGNTTISVPCGREKKTKSPKCFMACKIPSKCHHTNYHKCHMNDCPPCVQQCLLPNDTTGCEHPCVSKCHDAVQIKIVDKNFKPAGPWEAQPVKFEIAKLPHPKCEEKVLVECIGGHETVSRPCWDSKSMSCGRICGRPLKCGNHVCDLLCHAVDDKDLKVVSWMSHASYVLISGFHRLLQILLERQILYRMHWRLCTSATNWLCTCLSKGMPFASMWSVQCNYENCLSLWHLTSLLQMRRILSRWSSYDRCNERSSRAETELWQSMYQKCKYFVSAQISWYPYWIPMHYSFHAGIDAQTFATRDCVRMQSFVGRKSKSIVNAKIVKSKPLAIRFVLVSLWLVIKCVQISRMKCERLLSKTNV